MNASSTPVSENAKRTLEFQASPTVRRLHVAGKIVSGADDGEFLDAARDRGEFAFGRPGWDRGLGREAYDRIVAWELAEFEMVRLHVSTFERLVTYKLKRVSRLAVASLRLPRNDNFYTTTAAAYSSSAYSSSFSESRLLPFDCFLQRGSGQDARRIQHGQWRLLLRHEQRDFGARQRNCVTAFVFQAADHFR